MELEGKVAEIEQNCVLISKANTVHSSAFAHSTRLTTKCTPVPSTKWLRSAIQRATLQIRLDHLFAICTRQSHALEFSCSTLKSSLSSASLGRWTLGRRV